MKPNLIVIRHGQTELLTDQNHCTRGSHLVPCPKTTSRTQWEQFLFPDFQSSRQKGDFGVRHTANLRLDFGNRVLADVPANTRATRGQHGLRPAFAVTNFSHDGTDNVLGDRFTHNSALTVCERRLLFLPVSEGTNWPQVCGPSPLCLERQREM
jgi:hypothetical protein